MRILLILSFVFVCINSYSMNILQTENSCVKLSEIYPVSTDKEIICGLNYGEDAKISRSKIINLLSREKISYSNLYIRDIYVHRKGIKLSKSAIINKILKNYKKNYPDTDFTIRKIKLLKDIYAENDDNFKIDIKDMKFGSSYGIIDNGVKKERFYFYIEAFKNVYVTTGKIYKGSDLNDVEIRKMNITKLRNKPVENLNLYIAKRNIPSNVPLTLDYLIKRPINFEGDVVDLIYKSKTIYIETKGILLKNAYLNKRVKIKNIDSGKIIYAKAVRANKYLIIN